METFIIYNEENPNSRLNADHCLESFSSFSGWEPEIYNGCWKTTIPTFQEKYKIFEGERTKFKGNDEHALRKYACFYSHYSLWYRCAETNKPIAIVENDTMCIGDFKVDFDFTKPAMIQLTAESMLNPTKGVRVHAKMNNHLEYVKNGEGVHPVFYVHPHGKKYLAGNTGYIITPEAAKMLVEDCLQNGWNQNDLLVDTTMIDLYYVNPSPIEYVKQKELKSSSHKR